MYDKISTIDLSIIENLSGKLIEIIDDSNIASKFEPILANKIFLIIFRNSVDVDMFSLKIDSKFKSVSLHIISPLDYSIENMISVLVGEAVEECLIN